MASRKQGVKVQELPHGLQVRPSCASWVRRFDRHRKPAAQCRGERWSTSDVRRRRHSLTHLYAECSPQFGSWTEWDADRRPTSRAATFPANWAVALSGHRPVVDPTGPR